MKSLSQYFDLAMNYLSAISFDTLALIELCAFAGIYAVTLFGCIVSKRIRFASKRAFFHLTNAFTAITLALFATRFSAPQAIVAAAIFWCAGYLLYGFLCAVSVPPQTVAERVSPPLAARPPQPQIKPAAPLSAPAAQSVVRLDHAASIADKLLLKTLGRGDRQELEKIKTSLTVLKVKGELTPQDGEALNECFNALLKLMAKYDL